jgi:DNA-binding NarL/FixJ family response regulator
MSFTILVIDDDPGSRHLAQWLQDEGCAVIVARDESEGLRRLQERHIDGVIVDPVMFPSYTCQELVQHICRRTSARTAILVLTPIGSLESCRMCPLVRLGMMDCVDTPADHEDVVSRLFWLLRNGCPKPIRLPIQGLLSPREQDVLRWLRAGLSNCEIAARLFIAEKVVEKHITHICRKLDVTNRTAAVALSYRKPLFTLSARADSPL